MNLDLAETLGGVLGWCYCRRKKEWCWNLKYFPVIHLNGHPKAVRMSRRTLQYPVGVRLGQRGGIGSEKVKTKDLKSSIVNRQSKILSLDPSSTVVGYALVTWEAELLEAGLVTPDCRQPSYERIRSLRHQIQTLLEQQQPSTILIEWTKGKVGKRRHHGLGAGLAVYGCGLGAIATEVEHWANSLFIIDSLNVKGNPHIHYVLENDWTRGVPKEDRQAAIASEIPSYDSKLDPGGDIADAIGLAHWWLKEQLIKS